MRAGDDAAWLPEIDHDPLLTIAAARTRPERIELGTAITVAFARNPMTRR